MRCPATILREKPCGCRPFIDVKSSPYFLWQVSTTVDFLNLPNHLQENATFMTLIERARSVRADRSAQKYNVEHRLRLLEMEGDQKGVEAVREELREADKAFMKLLL